MNEHLSNSKLVQAAIWLADQREPPRLVVPALRQRFALSAVEACEAIAMARRFQINRRAFG